MVQQKAEPLQKKERIKKTSCEAKTHMIKCILIRQLGNILISSVKNNVWSCFYSALKCLWIKLYINIGGDKSEETGLQQKLSF